MDKRQELHQRIIAGHKRVDHLCKITYMIPKGTKRAQLEDKSIRLLQYLHDLEDGFMELYPRVCLFTDKHCLDSNKGCFPCVSCKEYLNSVYGAGQKMLV